MSATLKTVLLASILAAAPAQFALAEKKPVDYMPSLVTETPLEGRMLAVTIVRKTIGTIQRSPGIKAAVRAEYQDDPGMLMRAAELVAIEFKTIAIANNYWR